MRKTPAIPIAVAALAVLVAPFSAAAQEATQEATLNRVADGDFETGLISLSLPAVRRFPVFSGGWASRGSRAPEIIEGGYAGVRALRLESNPDDPLQILQDLPFDGAGFGLSLAFWVESGSQTIRLLTGWDRGDPSGGEIAFAVTLGTEQLVIATPEGEWQIGADIAAGRWHTLAVLADPRSGVQNVLLDGGQILSLPGVSARRPSTLLIGGLGAQAGTFRYDALDIVSLVDSEIALLRQASAGLDTLVGEALRARLDAAGMALERDAPALALSELGVAGALLDSYSMLLASSSTDPAVARGAVALAVRMQAAVAGLADLIEVEAEARRALRSASR